MNLIPESYKVKLPAFEGPLDLLLHLIRKNDVSISDIPISAVLNQYNEYLTLMQELNIDLAGEFILMAAELSYIKSKMLLPDSEGENEEGIDPRADLARRLLEYQQYKSAAQELIHRPMLGRDVFVRSSQKLKEIDSESILQVDLFKLLSAFQDVLKKVKPEIYHQVKGETLSVTERIYTLLELLKNIRTATFDSFFNSVSTKAECIVTFLAVLEMIRLKLIRVWQMNSLDIIRVELLGEKEEESRLVGSEFDQRIHVSSPALEEGVGEK